ncbi:MAG: thioredoxin fold domain-containing protein [Sulfurimonas sp.]|nr:thioredoxin fold domain-containing protein [Sulfurimonas sp.]
MKKIILIVTLLVSSLFAEMKWVDYDDALEIAQKENKIIMVMLSRENCVACEYMEDIVFDDNAVVKEVLKDFIPVHIDIYKGFIPNDDLSYIGTPTFHFLNKDEEKIGRIDGGINKKDFYNKLKEVLEAAK